MIKIGTIKNIFKGKRILICAYVSDRSPLKSSHFMLFPAENGEKYIVIGKGYCNTRKTMLKLGINKWSIYSYIGKEPGYQKSFVWLGIGRFIKEKH